MDILIISIRGIAIILFIITGVFLYRFRKELKCYKAKEEIAEDYFEIRIEKIKRVLILNIIAIILSLIGSLLKIILETQNVLQKYFI